MHDAALSPDAMTFYDRVSNGEKVIWQKELRYLCCFGSSFDGDWNTIAGGRYYGMYEPFFLYNELSKDLQDRQIIGIKFNCAHSQILQRPQLYNRDFREGLMVQDLLIDAIAYLRETNYQNEDWEETAGKLLLFAETEQLMIGPSIILEMLGTDQPTN